MRFRGYRAAAVALTAVLFGTPLLPPGALAQTKIEELERKLEQAKKDAQQKAARPAAAPRENAACQGGFSGQTYTDSRGLLWTASDNGRDVNWAQAKACCRGLGPGWSLPTVEQVLSLYDKSVAGMRCSVDGHICKVSSAFRLSSRWFWSAETVGSSEAWGVSLLDGDRHLGHVGDSAYVRALCVRRP